MIFSLILVTGRLQGNNATVFSLRLVTKSVPQTAAKTFTFSSVFILLLGPAPSHANVQSIEKQKRIDIKS